LYSVFDSWRNFVEDKQKTLLNHQQEEDRRILTAVFLHWKEFTKKRRLAKQLVSIRIDNILTVGIRCCYCAEFSYI